MTVSVLASIFLAAAMASLVVQTVALHQILRRPGEADDPAWRFLRRTARCRVGYDVGYVTLGVVTLIAPGAAGVVAVGVFIAVKVVGLVNARCDVALRDNRAMAHGLNIAQRDPIE